MGSLDASRCFSEVVLSCFASKVERSIYTSHPEQCSYTMVFSLYLKVEFSVFNTNIVRIQ